jgi:hypothetical protein
MARIRSLKSVTSSTSHNIHIHSRRSFNGALNGNVSVIKSIIAEITDPTNMPQVYAYVPIAWSFGGAIGYV